MGAWQEIVDYTVPSGTQSLTLTNFGTITKNDFIKIETTLINTNTNDYGVDLHANTLVNKSDYTRQTLSASGSSVGAGRSNYPSFDYIFNNNAGFTRAYLKLSENDRYNLFHYSFYNITSGGTSPNTPYNAMTYVTTNNQTFPNGITSLTFTSDATGRLIAAGSRIQIYKLAATKVADIIVETNSTQVNIPTTGIFDPAIDKDSEYLLVSDLAVGASITDLFLMVNGITTTSSYHSQRISGAGSTAGASRVNTPRYGFMNSGEPFLAYSHIKLSNIGAYTSQSYGMQAATTTNVSLRNDFVSSTAENITSITAINIRSSNANSIGAGSRFTLYKLYE